MLWNEQIKLKSAMLSTTKRILVLLLVTVVTHSALGTVYIPSDTSVGNWNPATRVFKLNTDIIGHEVVVDQDNLTVDGAGHSIVGPATHPSMGNQGITVLRRTGVTLKNLNVSGSSAHIYLEECDGCIVSDNNTGALYVWLQDCSASTLTGNNGRIWLGYCTGTTISNNQELIELEYCTGATVSGNYGSIRLQYCAGTTVSGNTVIGSHHYFRLAYSMSTTVSDNTILDGQIWMEHSHGNIIKDNAFEYYHIGLEPIVIRFSDNNIMTGNTVSNSDNRRMGYWIVLDYSHGNTVADHNLSGRAAGGINMNNSNFNTLKNNALTSTTGTTDADAGIHVGGHGNILTGNTVTGWEGGFGFTVGSDNTLKHNIVSNNARGIFLTGTNNIIRGNTISDNEYYGIHLSSDNQVYNNNFIGNPTQVQAGVGNLFNLDLPVGGNYFSDHTGPDTDGDGIVDTPYVFNGGQDNLPWAHENGWIPKIAQDQIDQVIADVIDLNLQAGVENTLDAKLDTAFQALDDLNENNDVAAINSLQALINAVEAQRGKQIADADADTLIAATEAIIAGLSF